MPKRDEIVANVVPIGDFSANAIPASFAKEIAQVLVKNTSIRELTFNGADLTDDSFKIIANALIERKQLNSKLILNILNVDNTNLTHNSIPILKQLIDTNTVKTLLMYAIEGVDEKTQDGIKLLDYAKQHEVRISYDHRRHRENIGFFDSAKSHDELKERLTPTTEINKTFVRKNSS